VPLREAILRANPLSTCSKDVGTVGAMARRLTWKSSLEALKL